MLKTPTKNSLLIIIKIIHTNLKISKKEKEHLDSSNDKYSQLFF